MTEEDQTFLLDKLKEIARMKNCYEKDKFYDAYDDTRTISKTVEDAEEWGMINLARTLLEGLGESYE